jgi:hypothetical protein
MMMMIIIIIILIIISAKFYSNMFIHEFRMSNLGLISCICNTLAFLLLYIFYFISVTVCMYMHYVHFLHSFVTP